MNDGAIPSDCTGGCGRVGVGERCHACEEAAETRCTACGGDAATVTASGITYFPSLCPRCESEDKAEREANACEWCGEQRPCGSWLCAQSNVKAARAEVA